jgi:curved DNA-binding protein CbpA
MGTSAESEEARSGTPRLAAGYDPTSLSLSPEEGFLLSRIDGSTPWSLLREISGLPPQHVDRCLERWLDGGVLEMEGARPAAAAPPAAVEACAAPEASTSEEQLDPDLELDLDVQRRVLEFESRLGESYYEILGVEPSAEPREIKRAYFRLSREFHPDRYFRRKTGPFGRRLERIFRKLLEAHEMLSDPMARAEMEKSLAQGAGREPQPARPTELRVGPAEAQRRLKDVSAQAKVVRARRQKAKHYFETGMAAFRAERWLEAAASVRLAIAFDPANEAYRESFAEVQQRAHEERAKQLVREGEAALEVRDYGRAFHAFEDAVHFRPHDAELYSRAARIAWLSGDDLRKAKDLARVACELEPDHAAYRRTLGQIYDAAGLEANARRELKRALELDPSDDEARSAWAGLGRG